MSKVVEEVHGKLIPPQTETSVYAWTSKTFKFTDIDKIPIRVPDLESIYVVTCWDTNCFIKVLNEEGEYEILDQHGSKLVYDKEYIIIRTKY